jgi:hypothetical protein
VVYRLGGHYDVLEFKVGATDDAVKPAVLEVWLDGVRAFASPVMRKAAAAAVYALNVAGVDEVRFVDCPVRAHVVPNARQVVVDLRQVLGVEKDARGAVLTVTDHMNLGWEGDGFLGAMDTWIWNDRVNKLINVPYEKTDTWPKVLGHILPMNEDKNTVVGGVTLEGEWSRDVCAVRCYPVIASATDEGDGDVEDTRVEVSITGIGPPIKPSIEPANRTSDGRLGTGALSFGPLRS